MTVKHNLRRLLWSLGYDVSRFEPGSHPIARRRRLLADLQIGVILDVGANTGQYGKELRDELRFRGHIRSFEPMSTAFRELETRASGDSGWETFNFALGDAEGTDTINISGNSYSSSILDMLSAHEAAAPESKFVGKEQIKIQTLDAIFEDVCPAGERVYLKIDTQGYEGRVLRGAQNSLSKVDAVQLEMPLVPLYEGELSFADLYDLIVCEGYTLAALDPGFNDPSSGRLLQVDGIFVRAR